MSHVGVFLIARATDRARKAREQERREQQKQASAVTKCDDGRLQAYGWSLPSKFPAHAMTEAAATKSQPIPIPVPIYCRPIMEEEATTKVFIAWLQIVPLLLRSRE